MALPTIYTIFPTGDPTGGLILVGTDVAPATEIHTALTSGDIIDHVEVRATNTTTGEATLTLALNSGASFGHRLPPQEGLSFVGDFALGTGSYLLATASVSGCYLSVLARREDQTEILGGA